VLRAVFVGVCADFGAELVDMDGEDDHIHPAVLVGSLKGAAVHLVAALGVPWLPQTLLIPVRQRGVHPDEPAEDLRAMVEPVTRLLAANPELVLRYTHGNRVRRIVFEQPEDLSPLVTDLCRGTAAERLLVESFILPEPWWALHGGAVRWGR
jgi:hypothetical protein